MTTKVKFLSLVNVLSRTILNNGFRYNFPALQQTAYLKQSIQEKLNLPPKPKRPLSAYFKFMVDVRPKVIKELPNANVTEIVREVANRWEKVDPQVKQNFETEYKKQLETYTKAKLQYDTQLTEEQKIAIKQLRIEQMQEKEKRMHRKKCRENKKPKRPPSAFVLYMKTESAHRGSQPLKEWRQKIVTQWNQLTSEQKNPFVQQVTNEMREYQKKLMDWERKMIQMGNTDLVRHESLLETKQKQNIKSKDKKRE